MARHSLELKVLQIAGRPPGFHLNIPHLNEADRVAVRLAGMGVLRRSRRVEDTARAGEMWSPTQGRLVTVGRRRGARRPRIVVLEPTRTGRMWLTVMRGVGG